MVVRLCWDPNQTNEKPAEAYTNMAHNIATAHRAHQPSIARVREKKENIRHIRKMNMKLEH